MAQSFEEIQRGPWHVEHAPLTGAYRIEYFDLLNFSESSRKVGHGPLFSFLAPRKQPS
jgi:hypothetical protein